jgi:hypothetical protein
MRDKEKPSATNEWYLAAQRRKAGRKSDPIDVPINFAVAAEAAPCNPAPVTLLSDPPAMSSQCRWSGR